MTRIKVIRIISPQNFKTIPWKNGLGETTELAISEGGTLDEFDWRLSIASVTENGVFSDFSGYARNLILISGNGITLDHTNGNGDLQSDNLQDILSLSSFDGGCNTTGKLTDGPIKDFNIMTKAGKVHALVKTYQHRQTVPLLKAQHYFVYCLEKSALFHVDSSLNNKAEYLHEKKIDNQILPVGHLMRVSNQHTQNITLMGEGMIVIQLNYL